MVQTNGLHHASSEECTGCGHSRVLHKVGVGCFGVDGIPEEDRVKVYAALAYRSTPICSCKQFDPPCHYTDSGIHEKMCKKPEWELLAPKDMVERLKKMLQDNRPEEGMEK